MIKRIGKNKLFSFAKVMVTSLLLRRNYSEENNSAKQHRIIPLDLRSRIKIIFYFVLVFLSSYIAGINLGIPIFLICLTVYIKLRNLNVKNHSLLNLTLLFLLSFASSYFISKQRLGAYYIPFSTFPFLTTLLFANLELTLLLSLSLSITVASISNYPLSLTLLFLISGILTGLLTQDARRRSTVIRAGLSIGIAQLIIAIFTLPYLRGFSLTPFFFILNGIISSIIALGVLPIFEYLFKTVTNISLLELADFKHPLLERMLLEATGTYHHSLVVGNLSETAGTAIGANALLARVGAYYHDIGKLQKPQYFSENQDITLSKHDTLSPAMSKLVIMNHVKEGLELARKYKLNPRIIDFIAQHHGNSLVYYFYRRALESLEENQEVKEEGYRYPGPKPDTKETAIVLLADSAEAATRALKNPTPSKIEEVVHKVINNKFIDGQLDECDLTLKDLEKISDVFIRILSGIYHNRVTYPDEDNHKKSPRETPPQSEKAQKSNP